MSEDNNEVKEPTSLFSLCLHYISSNISDVDSLIGFPQLIGLQLFEECVKKKEFVDIRKSIKAKNALKIFFDAYGSQGILESLDLRTCHLFVNDTLSDCPWLLSYIGHLDLSSCKLGDNHELLALVMNLARLDTLNLSDNCLSDRGIWKATLPLKFHNRTNICLKNLDLSSNNITPECLTHLAPLGSLAVVRVSHTSTFSLKAQNPKSHGRFTSHLVCPCLDARFAIVSRGWAGDVIDSWKRDYSVDSSSCDTSLVTSSKPTSSSPATAIQHKVKSFYSKLFRVPQAVKESSQGLHSNDVMLTTGSFHCEHAPCQRQKVDHTSPLAKQTFSDDKLGLKASAITHTHHMESYIPKRKRSECENDACPGKASVRKLSRSAMVHTVFGQCEGMGVDKLLDFYTGEDTQKAGHDRQSLLKELHDWNQ